MTFRECLQQAVVEYWSNFIEMCGVKFPTHHFEFEGLHYAPLQNAEEFLASVRAIDVEANEAKLTLAPKTYKQLCSVTDFYHAALKDQRYPSTQIDTDLKIGTDIVMAARDMFRRGIGLDDDDIDITNI